jgi:predicted PurR-regulated permease PerM
MAVGIRDALEIASARGAWGTILAVPMLVILKSVADHVPSRRPVGRLMAP